ncbi:amidohydrolase, partial [archaeon]
PRSFFVRLLRRQVLRPAPAPCSSSGWRGSCPSVLDSIESWILFRRFHPYSSNMSDLVQLDTSDSTSKEHIYVLPEVYALNEEIITNRRWFHAHPELSFEEVNTAAKIVEILKSYGITEIYEQIGKTGVVALIRGSQDGPCIGLRADMDALPLTETANVSYKSQNDGAMHACGHDGHISGLLATAKILFSERESLKGSVKLVFQPAEEGYAGAKAMLNDGVLDNKFGPKVDEIYGIHLWSFSPLGDVGCQDGPVMAASDRFTITVKGQGGHGAAPHQTVDAIVEAATLVTSLQTVISRSKVE